MKDFVCDNKHEINDKQPLCDFPGHNTIASLIPILLEGLRHIEVILHHNLSPNN